MRKRWSTVTALLMLAVMFLVPCIPGGAFEEDLEAKAAYEAKLKAAQDLKAEYERAKAEMEALIGEFSIQKQDVEAYISELDDRLNEIALAIFELEDTIADTEDELELTKADLEEAKAREAEQYATMCARVKYIYENGETTYLDVLFNSSGIADMLNQFEYVSRIQEYDNGLLEKYKEIKAEVEQKEAYLEASLEELNAMKAQAELNRSTNEELMALKTSEIESITEQLGIADEYLFTYMTEISNQEMAIDEIIAAEEERVAEEERRRLEEEERLRQEEEARKLAEQRAAEAAKTHTTEKVYDPDAINYVVLTDETDPYEMIWPLPGDHRTYSKFGYRKAPTKGASTYHQGWDIGGEFGAPIVSVLAGYAIEVDKNSSAGNYVKIEHEDGFVTVYCHMSKQLVSEGDYVRQGQKIGLIGSTGVSTGPHLHFSVKIDGTYVDPDPYIGHLE